MQVGNYLPPEPVRVQPMMDDCVDLINRRWERVDAVTLAAWALWRINYIHPFINGNGRTSRAVCYFIICVKMGGPLPGSRILPDRLKDYRDVYIEALKLADQGNHLPLQLLVRDLLEEQLNE